ncbi:MAG: hypothetical protein A2Y64_01445 [Candidatus Coatesbacteria bacterium RBG_13_66_14]|uniref:Uncharacterized protein n=1 Tax=Candidatus Coatesbacteria bacterium RBG_13_66_14 TaxID=1817816 RepID=A0A1F5FH75_9BACT|nr:MAG: hypothetical protein A2Y64_01445 [Candidatus Coatesbacteria bacterium RBG_13_66_14]
MDWIWIVAMVAGILLLLVVILRITLSSLRRLAEGARDDVVAALGEENILLLEPAANCFGEKSRGPAQVRGNGCWALTREKICFEYWVGRRIIEVPIRSVIGTRIVKSFLGKTRGLPLLVVAYRNEQGEEDECAWWFKDTESVKRRLDGLIAESGA